MERKTRGVASIREYSYIDMTLRLVIQYMGYKVILHEATRG